MRSGGVTTPLVGGAAASPLGQARPSAASRSSPRVSSSEASAELRAYQAPLALSDNPYLAAAAPLLDLIVEIPAAQAHPNVADLQSRIAEQVRGFERRAIEAGATPDYVQAARYTLCSALDEAVLTTDWGAESAWSQQSLLSQFHNDVWGGEKVFEMLEELRRTPKRAIDVIELIAFLIGLGFEGRYRVMNEGAGQLEDLRRELFRQIRIERDERPIALANDVQRGVVGRGLRRYVPIWVVASVCAAVLTLNFFYFEERFQKKLEPVLNRLDALIQDQMNAAGGGS
jgi:type VI secretion system protein ImpK